MTATMSDERRPEGSGEIQVTVIGGYLGAGKTTLVNHILRTADSRIAVLVNDFGDINIDEDLIASQDGDTISLANGCICCSLVDGFSSALETIQALDPLPERLVIESSGVADPATVAAYGHGPGLALDATIVVVDAETIRKKARDEYVGDTIVGQLGSGDIVIMNKVDLVTDGDAAATRDWLSDRCPDAVIIEAANGEVDPAVLFGVVEPQLAAPHEHVDGDGHQHAESLFEAWSWSGSQPLTRAMIEDLMDVLPETVVRAKGIVLVDDEPDVAMALQRVGQRWSLRPFGPRDDTTESRIVFIGFHEAISDAWLSNQLERG